ncbi:MAG: kinase [Gammaproteobacteria bacterium]
MNMRAEGSQSIVITQTPFRISFFGGGTDFPDYFNQYHGAVLGAAIDKFMYVTLNSLKRLDGKRIRLSYSKLEFVDDPLELEHQIVKHVLVDHKFFSEDDFLDIHSYADLPASSGIGSSSSFAVGMLNALYLSRGVYKFPGDIAREAILIEREKMKDRGGWQDQVFAAYGGLNRIIFGNNNFIVEPIVISKDKRVALEEACLLFFTGKMRSSSQVQNSVMSNDNVNKIEMLGKIHDLVQNGFDILYHSKTDVEMVYEFGRLLHESWNIKRNLSSHVTNQDIDCLYEEGIRAGALGGKLCGAGGGGFILFVVPKDKRDNVMQSLSKYKRLNIRFHDFGSRVIYSRVVN